jgi:response regulator RpfG family c-di-GMP phosphodiesterase/signal transduction histidine kinase
MDKDRRPFPLPGWVRLLTGRGHGASTGGGARAELDATLKELFLQEEAKNEVFLNAVILFGLIPLLAVVAIIITVLERFSLNSLVNLGCLAVAIPYYLVMHFLLHKGAYRPSFKYLTLTINILLSTCVFVGYSFSSGWIHAIRTVVLTVYFLLICLSGLYHNPRLPIFAGLFCSANYTALVLYGLLVAKVRLTQVETFFQPDYSLDILLFSLFLYNAVGVLTSYASRRFRAVLTRSLDSEAQGKAMRELDAQKTSFFSNVSHELRTPLTLILSPLESLLADNLVEMPAKHRETLGIVHLNALRLLKLINNLLDFTKLEAGRMELNRQKTELVRTIEYYLSTIRSAVETKEIGLDFQKNGNDELFADIDRFLFEKAVFNLFSNALKFTPTGGRVTVSLERYDGTFRLSVRDTGIGIPADKLKYIFQRFNQVDSTLSRRYEGTGIGLSLAKEIVELHEGSITVQSVLGQGSEFIITMPIGTVDVELPVEELKALKPSLLSELQQRPHAVTGDDEPAVAGQNRNRVLVVDDNADLRDFLKSLLVDHYEVDLAADGMAALARISRRVPDIVVSDLMMPKMNGYELCDAIKKDPALMHLPVILLTAKTEIAMKHAGYQFGADDYLGKPFDPEELLSKIRVFLAREDMRKRLEELTEKLQDANSHLEEKVGERTAQLEERFYQTLDSLVNALEEKDAYTKGHSLRVEKYSLLIAEDLGLSAEDRQTLSISAKVHDIGKIGIPGQILNKPGDLTAEEYRIIKQHPEKGAKILAPLKYMETAIEVARKHHERFDGTGYLGYPREEFPILAQILSVADAFDAMTSSRAYRGAMTVTDSLREMVRNKGTQFNPAIVDALSRVVGKGV